jgi:hypothetical protein
MRLASRVGGAEGPGVSRHHPVVEVTPQWRSIVSAAAPARGGRTTRTVSRACSTGWQGLPIWQVSLSPHDVLQAAQLIYLDGSNYPIRISLQTCYYAGRFPRSAAGALEWYCSCT